MVDATQQVRFCSWHGTEHPVEDFSFKNKAKGTLQSKCKEGQREYSALHYKANRDTRIVELRARSKRVRAVLQAIVDEARADASCALCSTSNDLLSHHPHEQSLWNMVRSEAPEAKLRATLADPDRKWLCTTCFGMVIGTLGRGVSTTGRDITIDDAIIEHLDSGPATITELLVAIGDRTDPPSRESLTTRLSEMSLSKQIVRVERGVYALAESDGARSSSTSQDVIIRPKG